MEIVLVKTGVACVYLPEDGVLVVDPDLKGDEIVAAVQAALPDARPEAIQHWVEAATATLAPAQLDGNVECDASGDVTESGTAETADY